MPQLTAADLDLMDQVLAEDQKKKDQPDIPYLPPRGQIEPGNIDLTNRPIVKNPDGSISTVRSSSFDFGGREVLLPTISDDGRNLSRDETIAQYRNTGRHLGIFDSPQASDEYAQQLHEDQAKRYLPQSQDQATTTKRGPIWPGPEVLEPRRTPEPVPEPAPTTENPFESAYQNILQERNQKEFQDRGILRSGVSAIASGLTGYGEMALRQLRTYAPEGSAAGDLATSGLERIKRFQEEAPFLQQDPNAGYIGKSLYGGVQSATQSVAAGLPGAAAGAAIGSMIAPGVGTALGAVAGFALSGATQFGVAQYDDVMERGKEKGITPDHPKYGDLQASAIRQGIYEGGFEFASDILEGWMMGAGKMLTASAKEAAKATIKDMTKVSLGTFLKRAAGLTAAETSTEMATQALESEEDYQLGIGNQRYWEGAIDAFGPSVVASMIFAGLGHANVKLAQRNLVKTLENPEADPRMRESAASEVYDTLKQYDPKIAYYWGVSADQAIQNKLPISTDDDVMALGEKIQAMPEGKEKEAAKAELQKILTKLPEQPIPTTREGLETEQQYLDNVRRTAPYPEDSPHVDFDALKKREEQIQMGLDAEDLYEERKKLLNTRITNLENTPKPSKKQNENLEKLRSEWEESKKWEDQAADLGIRFVGMWQMKEGEPPVPTFNYTNGGTFTINKGETLEDAVRRKYEQFKTPEEKLTEESAPKPWEMTRDEFSKWQRVQPKTGDATDNSVEKMIDKAVKSGDRVNRDLVSSGVGGTKAKWHHTSMQNVGYVQEGDFWFKKPASTAIDQAANKAATSPANELPEPTEAQIEAGNYRKGHINFQGLDISIENPRGSTRKGVSPEGKPWETELTHHYGYIKGTVGKDKDHIDAFIGPNVESDRVFVVDQSDPKTGKFDEHKVMMGFQNQEEARQGYLSNYDKGWKGLGAMTEMSMDEFKSWIKEGNIKKPFAQLGNEVPSDREGEIGVAGTERGRKEKPGGTVPEQGGRGETPSPGGILQTPEGGKEVAGGIDISKQMDDILDTHKDWDTRLAEASKLWGFTPPDPKDPHSRFKSEEIKLRSKYAEWGNRIEIGEAPNRKFTFATSIQLPNGGSSGPLSVFDRIQYHTREDALSAAIDHYRSLISSHETDRTTGRQAKILKDLGTALDEIEKGIKTEKKEPRAEGDGSREKLISDLEVGGKYDLVMKAPGQKKITNVRGLTFEKKDGKTYWFRGVKGNLELFTEDSVQSIVPSRTGKEEPHAEKTETETKAPSEEVTHPVYKDKIYDPRDLHKLTTRLFADSTALFQQSRRVKNDSKKADLQKQAGKKIHEARLAQSALNEWIEKNPDEAKQYHLKAYYEKSKSTAPEITEPHAPETLGESPGLVLSNWVAENTRLWKAAGSSQFDQPFQYSEGKDKEGNRYFAQRDAQGADSYEVLKKGSTKGEPISKKELLDKLENGEIEIKESTTEGKILHRAKPVPGTGSKVTQTKETPEAKTESAKPTTDSKEFFDFKDDLNRKGAARIGKVDYKVLKRDDGTYYYSRVKDGMRIEKGGVGPRRGIGWDRETAIQKIIEDAGFQEATTERGTGEWHRDLEVGDNVKFSRPGTDPYEMTGKIEVTSPGGGDYKVRGVNGLTYNLYSKSGHTIRPAKIEAPEQGKPDFTSPATSMSIPIRDRAIEKASPFLNRGQTDDALLVTLEKFAAQAQGEIVNERINSGEPLTEREVAYLNNWKADQFAEAILDYLKRKELLAEAEQAEATKFGSENKIFTEDKANKAREILRKKLSGIHMGVPLDPEIIQAGIDLAGYYIEGGSRSFVSYSKKMISDLGDMIRPYLKSFYMAVRNYPGFDKAGMDNEAALDEIDENKIDISEKKPIIKQTDLSATEGANEDLTVEDRPTSRDGDRALEGTQSDNVPEPEKVGETGGRGPGSGGKDLQRNGELDRPGNPLESGLGDDQGKVPVSSGGRGTSGSGRRGTPVSGGIQPDGGLHESSESGDRAPREHTEHPQTAPKIDRPKAKDYVITDLTQLGEGGQKTKYRNNIEAIKLLKELDETDRPATSGEQDILARYVGWGAIPQAFDPANEKWSSEYVELQGLLDEEEYEAARQSTQYAHYTSDTVINGIYKALKHLGFNGGVILEPGSGVGNFVGLMPDSMRTSSRFTGIERERIAAGIAKHLYPNQNMQQKDFTYFRSPNEHYDLSVGNPPFGKTELTDMTGRKHLTGLSIHNYFIAKSVDLTRPGGIISVVVSRFFMDAKNSPGRKYIADRTRFLGAIRLPNTAFTKNAGTEVTTDIIFLQKLPENEFGSQATRKLAEPWSHLGQIDDPHGREAIQINNYYIDHPEMLLGRMERTGTMRGAFEPTLSPNPNVTLSEAINQAVQNLPKDVFVPVSEKLTQNMERDSAIKLENPEVGEGGHFLDGANLYRRITDREGVPYAQEITPDLQFSKKEKYGPNRIARIKQLTAIRFTTRALLAAEMSDNTEKMGKLRKKLNRQYDEFVQENGPINWKKNYSLMREDPDVPLLMALEEKFDKGITANAAKKLGVKPIAPSATKHAIFSARVVLKRESPTSAETPEDAIMISLAERGKIDADYIGKLLGKDGEKVISDLAEKKDSILFVNPATHEYELKDAYLSGNVRRKLYEAERSGLVKNIEALSKVIPEDVPPHEISGSIGSPWIPVNVYEDFVRSLLGEGTEVKIKYIPVNSSFMVKVSNQNEIHELTTYGTQSYPASRIIHSLLNNREIKVTYKDNDGNVRVDKESTDESNDKASEIKDKFTDWLFADDLRSEEVSRAFNNAKNNYVTRTFDGSWLSFAGKVPDEIIKFRRHQTNGIARIIQSRTSLLDHEVGSGKTFTMISSAMEMKRMGIIKKPLFTVPNHLVKQWASEFYRLYPGAKILAATKKDFERENRRKFLARISTGDWDAVIMAHSSFGFIRPDPAIERQVSGNLIKEITNTINSMRSESDPEDKTANRTIKQLEALWERLENRIKRLRDKPVDDILDFEQIGFDQLYVDEAHLFKNLLYHTKQTNISGLGNAKGSQRAYDMYLKVMQIFKKNGRDQGVVFATGTPISNSLAEMYHMMRYLMPTAMEENGYTSFDAWANTFAEVTSEWMQAFSGQGYKQQNRMGTFVNAKTLLAMFDQVSDTVSNNDLKKAYAEDNPGKEFPLPKLKGGKRQPISILRSDSLKDYMVNVIAPRAAALKEKRGKPQKGDDNALWIMTDGRKAAMDMRLVDPTVTERDPNGRIATVAKAVADRYKKFDHVRGTQLIFSDMGTPKKHASKELKEFQELQQKAAALEDEQIVAMAGLGDEDAIKKLSDAEDAAGKLAEKGRDWRDAIDSALRGFSVYDDLKAAMVENGIPENEIAFIHDYNTDDQKAALFAAVNSGKIRVLMGSTPKLGAGTNVQERLVALHHVDIPWKPSDVEQREGRIVRQGNMLMDEIPDFEVEILAYATQDTLDFRMWQTQEKKLAMIGQLRERNVGNRIENAFEEMRMGAEEMQAAATSNPYVLEELQIRDSIKKLERQRRSHESQGNELKRKTRQAERDIQFLPDLIENQKELSKGIEKYSYSVDHRFDDFSVTIDGKEFADPEQAGNELRNLVDVDEGEIPISINLDGKIYTNQKQLLDALEALMADAMNAGLEDEEVSINGKDVHLFSGGTFWKSLSPAHKKISGLLDKQVKEFKKENKGKWPPPISVEFNGETFTSRTKLSDRFRSIVGDSAAVLWEADGEILNTRKGIVSFIEPLILEVQRNGKTLEIGRLGDIKIEIAPRKEKGFRNEDTLFVILTYNGKGTQNYSEIPFMTESDESNYHAAAHNVLEAVKSEINNNEWRLGRNIEQLDRSKKNLAELEKMGEGKAWGKEDELRDLRARHKVVLKKLSDIEAGHAPTEESAQDTNDKDLLRLEEGGLYYIKDTGTEGSTRKSLLSKIDKAIARIAGDPEQQGIKKRLLGLATKREKLYQKLDDLSDLLADRKNKKEIEQQIADLSVQIKVINLGSRNVRFVFSSGKGGGYTVPNNLYALEGLRKSVDNSTDIQFSIATEQGGPNQAALGVSRDDLQKAIEPIVGKWTNAPAGGVRIVQAQNELPQRIQDRAKGRTIEGLFDPSTKTIWVVADNIPTMDRAQEVIAHEAYGHYGLEAFLGQKKANAFLGEVVALFGKSGLKSIAEDRGFDLFTKEGRLKAAGEKLAQMAETGERPGLLKRIYAAVREAMRQMGFTIKLTDGDIQAMLSRSRRWVEGGQAKEGVAGTQPLSFSAKLAGQQERFGENVDLFLKGDLKPGSVITVSDTPEVLRRLGAEQLPIVIDQGTLRKVLSSKEEQGGKHGISAELVKQIPKQLNDPIMVFDSSTQPNSMVVMTELQHQGRTVVVAIHLSKTLPNRNVVNDISSIHPRERDSHFTNWINQGLLRYVNEQKSREWFMTVGLQLPVARGTMRDFINTVLTEKDLVKPETSPENDPDLLFSLSAKDLIDKAQAKLQGTPKAALNVVFGQDTDIGDLGSSFRIPAWLAKSSRVVKNMFNRQNQRDKDRSKLYHDFLQETAPAFDLKGKDQDEFAKLAFELENNKVVGPEKYKKTGTRDIVKGPGREIVTVPVYALNEAHYQELDTYLRGRGVSGAVREAYLATRRALDSSLIMTHDRLAEIKGLDPTLIEQYRNQMGRIHNYFPHNRYGNFHIKAIDPTAKPGDETRYREHFNAANDRHAKFWYAKNVDRIISEMEKEHPDIEWRNLEWTVDRNRDLPEEVYDFPIPVDAMQMIVDSAVENMPEETGIKSKLRKELSLEISNVLKSRGFGSHMIKRKDIPGFEKADASRVLHDHFAGFSGWMTKMSAAHDFGRMLRDIDAKNNPAEYRWATRFVHDMLENQTRMDRTVEAIKSVFFMQFLGGNIKSMIVNLTQNMVSGVPRLSMDTGIASASREFVKAAKDIRLATTEKRIGMAPIERLSDDEKQFLGDMFAEGWGQSQFVNEIRGKVGGKYKKTMNKVTRVLGFPMEIAERYNRLTLGLAAYRAARSGEVTNAKALKAMGLKEKQKAGRAVAKQFAETIVNDAHFVYGKSNRPQFMRGSPAGKALSTAYTFRSFTHNMISMWRWMLASGDKDGKRAFAYSILAMISLGGLSAIPLYNSLAALIRELFGSDLLGSGVRKQLPPGMRDMVMYGGPALMGVNIGGSIGMELPVIDRLNVNKKISGQLGEGIGSLLGVPYSVFEEFTKAVDSIKAGRPDRAAESVAPMFLRNIMSAVRLSTEGQTTITGRPIAVPGERYPRKLTEGEAVLKGLGFQPVSSTKAFEMYRSLEELKSYRDEKQSELANRYVAAMRKDDNKEMVAARNEAMAWNRKAVTDGRPEMKIDLNAAIKARRKPQQPMKQMRGMARELRENYGI